MSKKPRLFHNVLGGFEIGHSVSKVRSNGAIEALYRNKEKIRQALGFNGTTEDTTAAFAAPAVEFSYHSDGRLVVQCGGDIIALTPEDVTRFKSFLSQISMGGEGQ